MAHTCGVCGCGGTGRLVPTEEGFEKDRTYSKFYGWARRNSNYQHDIHSWKRSTKAKKQWARHF